MLIFNCGMLLLLFKHFYQRNLLKNIVQLSDMFINNSQVGDKDASSSKVLKCRMNPVDFGDQLMSFLPENLDPNVNLAAALSNPTIHLSVTNRRMNPIDKFSSSPSNLLQRNMHSENVHHNIQTPTVNQNITQRNIIFSMEESMSQRKNPTNTSFVSSMSCFTASKSKPVGTSVQPGKKLNEFGKLKVSAQKIYANLKKMKQTISSGGQFTNSISSNFTQGDRKEISESYLSKGCAKDGNADLKSKSTQKTTCSLASSLSRSCLSMKKSVRFCPGDVVVEDCHQTNSRQPKLPHVDHKRNDVSPHADHKSNDVSEGYENLKNYDFVLDFLRMRMMIFEDDYSNDWTSDLVELERLASVKNYGRYCENLPV